MKQSLIFLCLFLILFFDVSAQSDYRNAYIVKNNNDTLYGFIDYRGSKANSKKCCFKKDLNSDNQEFSPSEIRAYRFLDSKYYISKSVLIDGHEMTLFLEYLIKGIVDVYYYRDDFKEHYFVELRDGKLYELKNDEKEVYVNDTKYLTKSKEYIGVLKYAFRNSSEISRKLDNISLNHTSLIKIAHDYHKEQCSGEECIIYEKKIPRKNAKLSVLFGLNTLVVSEVGSLPSDYTYYLHDSHFRKKIYPSLGLSFKTNIPLMNERIYFQYDGTFSQIELETSNSFVDAVYQMQHTNDISLNQNSLSNTCLIRYEFPLRKFRPSISLGGFLNSFFSVEYSRSLLVRHAWGDIYKSGEFSNSPFNKLDYGFCLGVGAGFDVSKKRELSIDLRYMRGNQFMQGLRTNYWLLNFGFQLL